MSTVGRDRGYLPGTFGGWPEPGGGCGCGPLRPAGLPPQFTAPVQPTWGDGKDHAGHEGDCFGVGQALVEAQGAPGPERDRVADGRAAGGGCLHSPVPTGNLQGSQRSWPLYDQLAGYLERCTDSAGRNSRLI